MRQLDAQKVALVQVARQRLRLDDDAYRAILRRVGRCESSRDLSLDAFARVMDHFARLGFESDARKRNLGDRPGMASSGQVAAIRRLWGQYTGGTGGDASLGRWLERTFHVASVRFLPAELAPKAITALRAMIAKHGAGGGPEAA
jgi:phage gp16-like protein